MPPATIEPDVRTTRRTTTASSEYAEWDYAGYYVEDFKLRICQELDRLASLPPNWDGEGAPRVDPAIIEAVRRFVEELPDDIASLPAVVPSAAGNLQLEWNAGSRSLELEIETPSTIHYLKWHPGEGIEEEDVFNISDMDRAKFLIQWFMQGTADV